VSVLWWRCIALGGGGDHKARLCELRTWPDFPGYGFNLHAERGRSAQLVGKVDAESPADAVGLREGDRMVAVNGVDVTGETHQDVVRRIREDADRVELLVVDAAADAYLAECGVDVSATMSEWAVRRVACPANNVYTTASSQPAAVASDASKTVLVRLK